MLFERGLPKKLLVKSLAWLGSTFSISASLSLPEELQLHKL